MWEIITSGRRGVTLRNEVGQQRYVTYPSLEMDYRCFECGGVPVVKYDAGIYVAECGLCGGRAFSALSAERAALVEATEVMEGLPSALARLFYQQESAEFAHVYGFTEQDYEEARATLWKGD